MFLIGVHGRRSVRHSGKRTKCSAPATVPLSALQRERISSFTTQNPTKKMDGETEVREGKSLGGMRKECRCLGDPSAQWASSANSQNPQSGERHIESHHF